MSQYLALDGIYHPIQAAIPSNPTLQGRIVRPRNATVQDSHLLRYPVPRDLSGGRGRWRLSRLQFGAARGRPDWRRELCPLHSPLLGASRLFSSPPLSDMLKFSGWSHLSPDTVPKLVCLSTGSLRCTASTLNEFTLENVTAASSVTRRSLAERRVLSCLAIEGYLSH